MLQPVKSRPRASLGRVLEDLGPLLELAAGEVGAAPDISAVVIHDPLDEPLAAPGSLVLGVGLADPAEIAGLLADLAAAGAAALVVRAPVPVDENVSAAVRRSGVALLGLTRGASWAQLAAMCRSLIAEGDFGGETGSETLGGMVSGDLFALANAVAALLDAPVTIEDRNSRVLAFSGRQDEADPSRVQTILGRQVPELYTRKLEERGVFQALYRSDAPVMVEPLAADESEFALPRVAVAVRAGDEILGSIWAAVRTELSADRLRALGDAAKLVALHMMRLRAGADVERRLRADLVSTALEGGAGAAEALGRLGLADQPTVVLALTQVAPADGEAASNRHAQLVAERQRITDAFAMHLTAVHPRSAAALVGDVTYGIVSVSDARSARSGTAGDAEERAVRVVEDFIERIGDRAGLLAGVGPVALDGAALARSRSGADRALRVLRSTGASHRAVRMADVHIEALLLELGDLIAERGDPPTRQVARLLEYDAKHRTCLVQTLRAWLDAFGDVIAAAAAVYVHPNTFRYRLRRLAEVAGIDLEDPDARFAAMLQLRLMPGVGQIAPEHN